MKTMTLTELSNSLETRLTTLIDIAKELTTVENFLDRDINYRVTNIYSFIRSFAELTSHIKHRIEFSGEDSLIEDIIKKALQHSEYLIDRISTEMTFIQIKKDRKDLNLN